MSVGKFVGRLAIGFAVLTAVYAFQRPMPEAFCPPNGVRRSRANHVLTQTNPDFNLLETLWQRSTSLLHTLADSP